MGACDRSPGRVDSRTEEGQGGREGSTGAVRGPPGSTTPPFAPGDADLVTLVTERVLCVPGFGIASYIRDMTRTVYRTV
jgi:hypothetical protein